jgi:hypothetical protein
MEVEMQVISIEDGFAILKNDNEERIKLPTTILPPNIIAGNTVYITINKEKQKPAKEVLNEILNT